MTGANLKGPTYDAARSVGAKRNLQRCRMRVKKREKKKGPGGGTEFDPQPRVILCPRGNGHSVLMVIKSKHKREQTAGWDDSWSAQTESWSEDSTKYQT